MREVFLLGTAIPLTSKMPLAAGFDVPRPYRGRSNRWPEVDCRFCAFGTTQAAREAMIGIRLSTDRAILSILEFGLPGLRNLGLGSEAASRSASRRVS
jgi:hypothetical protein